MDRRLELIGELTPAIWVHVSAAFVALILGAFVLWRRKGDGRHRWMGRVWVATMVVVAVSSFGISTIGVIGPFSPIHLLSIYTLFSLVTGVGVLLWPSAKGHVERIHTHRITMQTLYGSALLIAGAFTFLPQRFLGRMTFGETMPMINYGIVAVMVTIGLVLIVRAYSHPSAGRVGRASGTVMRENDTRNP